MEWYSVTEWCAGMLYSVDGPQKQHRPQERQPEVNQKHLSWVPTCSSRESSNPNCIPLGNKAQGFLKTREKVCVCCSQGILVMLAAENWCRLNLLFAKAVAKPRLSLEQMGIFGQSPWDVCSAAQFKVHGSTSEDSEDARKANPNGLLTPFDTSDLMLFHLSQRYAWWKKQDTKGHILPGVVYMKLPEQANP